MSYAHLGQTVPVPTGPVGTPAPIASLSSARAGAVTTVPEGYRALSIGGSAAFASPLREFQDALVKTGFLAGGTFRPRYLDITPADPRGTADPTYRATMRAGEAIGARLVPGVGLPMAPAVIGVPTNYTAPFIAVEHGLYDAIMARAGQFWAVGPVRMHWTGWAAIAGGIAILGGGAFALGRRR